MKGLQKEIHGLKVKIGLRKSWIKVCQKHNREGHAIMAQNEIIRFENKIRKLTLLLDSENENSSQSSQEDTSNSSNAM